MPLQSIGGVSVEVGVIIAAVEQLLRAVFVLTCVRSDAPTNLVGVMIAPLLQVAVSAMTVAGVPLAVLACVAMVFKIRKHVESFFFYLAATITIDTAWIGYMLFAGDVCLSIVDGRFLRQGAPFVCAILNCMLLFWFLVYSGIRVALVYCVWSKAQDCHDEELYLRLPGK